jgi:hypothetical protein
MKFEREIREAISVIYELIDNPQTDEGITAISITAPAGLALSPGTSTIGTGLQPRIIRIPAGGGLALGATALYEGGKYFRDAAEKLGAYQTMEMVMRAVDTMTRSKRTFCEDCVKKNRMKKRGNP